MKIINIKDNLSYLKEYIKLCSLTWGSKKTKEEMKIYITNKLNEIKNKDNVISILGLTKDNVLVGFISLLKNDSDERKDISPWYATMYVKKEYRGNGYSKVLNYEILKEAKKLGYKKVYLKTTLTNYYEKFGFKFLEMINNEEKLYYIDL